MAAQRIAIGNESPSPPFIPLRASYAQIQPALHAHVLFDLLRLFERAIDRRHIHLRAGQQLLDVLAQDGQVVAVE
jgi:hypothetical protein